MNRPFYHQIPVMVRISNVRYKHLLRSKRKPINLKDGTRAIPTKPLLILTHIPTIYEPQVNLFFIAHLDLLWVAYRLFIYAYHQSIMLAFIIFHVWSELKN